MTGFLKVSIMISSVMAPLQDQIAFPDQFNGYSRIEFMSIFISFLYAFVISEFFVGWSRMIRNRDSIIFSLDQIAYSILFFWTLILNWWSLWVRMEFLGQGFYYFILIIIPIAMSYVVTVLLFPDLDKETDLNSYFDRNFRTIGISWAAFVLTYLLVGILMHEKVGGTIIFFRAFIGIFIFIIAFFNLKKLRRLCALIVFLLLLIGSLNIAFV